EYQAQAAARSEIPPQNRWTGRAGHYKPQKGIRLSYHPRCSESTRASSAWSFRLARWFRRLLRRQRMNLVLQRRGTDAEYLDKPERRGAFDPLSCLRFRELPPLARPRT